jgi:hypothetical protein
MSTVCAFELRPEYTPDPDGDGNETNPDAFHGGSIAANTNGKVFDVAKALEDGHGRIVTDDWQLANALRGFWPLHEVDTQDAEYAAARVEYARLKKTELVQLAEDRGLPVPDGATKQQIVDRLVAVDETRANVASDGDNQE